MLLKGGIGRTSVLGSQTMSDTLTLSSDVIQGQHQYTQAPLASPRLPRGSQRCSFPVDLAVTNYSTLCTLAQNISSLESPWTVLCKAR